MLKLKRFWFEFNDNNTLLQVKYCGVTAWNYDDALNIMRAKICEIDILPLIKYFDVNVDVSTLDKAHILTNMGAPNIRGIWYPLGYA